MKIAQVRGTNVLNITGVFGSSLIGQNSVPVKLLSKAYAFQLDGVTETVDEMDWLNPLIFNRRGVNVLQLEAVWKHLSAADQSGIITETRSRSLEVEAEASRRDSSRTIRKNKAQEVEYGRSLCPGNFYSVRDSWFSAVLPDFERDLIPRRGGYSGSSLGKFLRVVLARLGILERQLRFPPEISFLLNFLVYASSRRVDFCRK